MQEKAGNETYRYDAILRESPWGMHFYRLEADGGLVFTGANPAADRLLGVKNEKFIGKSIENAFPGLVGTEVPEAYKRVAASGAEWKTEQITYDEDKISGAFEVTAFQTAPGEMAAAFMDITERKRTEFALRESEEKYHFLFETMSQGVVVQDGEGRIQEANNAAARILGLSMDQLLGRTDSDPRWKLVHEDGSDMENDEMPSSIALRTGKPVFDKTFGVLIPETGEYRWMIVSSIPHFRRGGPVPASTVTTFTDITQGKNAEMAVRKQEVRLRFLVENIPGIFFSLDREGIFLLSEGKQLALIGLKPGQVVGLSAFDVYRDFPDIVDSIRRAFQGEVVRTENRIGEAVFQVIYNPVYNERGEISGLIGIASDFTEQRKAEELIRDTNAELEKRVARRTKELEHANRELESFSYSVSHDLRAPLRTIGGFSQIILEDHGSVLPADARRCFEKIREASNRMGSMIDDLLNLSRVSKVTLSETLVNISALCRRIAEELDRSAPERRTEWNIDDGMIVCADAHLVENAFQNLLSNAYKFTRDREIAEIAVTLKLTGEFREISVRDNGAGFDPAYKKKLFGVFQRLHQESEFPGTGIGLSIVHRIAERHGWSVRAEGEINRGATFTLVLPARNECVSEE